MYQGRTAAEAGLIFGQSTTSGPYCPHKLSESLPALQRVGVGDENMGIVYEIGSGVTLLKKGNRVVIVKFNHLHLSLLGNDTDLCHCLNISLLVPISVTSVASHVHK